MAEKWILRGTVKCDLCLDEQDIPEGRERPYLPGWRVVGAVDLCWFCRDVPAERVRVVCAGEADSELREALGRARCFGDWDSVRTLAPALRGGPREEADRMLAERKVRAWASGTDSGVLVETVQFSDCERSAAAWIELARRFCRAKHEGSAPPVTAEWLVSTAEGELASLVCVRRALREIAMFKDYVPRPAP